MENIAKIVPCIDGSNLLQINPNSIDMELMSMCRYNIIANSSYSWWAGWLNSNVNKIVIAPKFWFNENTLEYDIKDLIPSDWVLI